MKKIKVEEAVCRGCRLCRKACPTGAIDVYDGLAHIGEQCMGCEKCLNTCPFHAIKKVDAC